ncbi:MAG: hypothetical protein HY059_05710 [Proteobacteria bacterium]|nr:hypothetical protein [Pseudomonadota bacterium]
MLAIALALVIVQGTSGDAQPSCDVRSGLITNRAIGPFRVGESVAALRRRCPFVHDTAFKIESEFADSAHALVAKVRGVPVLIYSEDNKVVGVSVEEPGLATEDGLEVGISISRFRTMRDVEVSVNDYGPGVFLWVPSHCGVSFHLNDWGRPLPESADVPLRVRHHELDAWPDAIRVKKIVVIVDFCRR